MSNSANKYVQDKSEKETNSSYYLERTAKVKKYIVNTCKTSTYDSVENNTICLTKEREAEIDKINLEIRKSQIFSRIQRSLFNCGHIYIKGICKSCGKQYLKKLYCNQEFCQHKDCQKAVQKRRIARNWGRFVQLGKKVGYFVFTIPKECREKLNFENFKEKFRLMRTKLRYKLKQVLGNDLKAIGRIHQFNDDWFGCDLKSGYFCKHRKISKKTGKRICSDFFDYCPYKHTLVNEYYPHYNLLINQGFINKDDLNFIRFSWTQILNEIFACNINEAVVLYEYSKISAQKVHWLKYVLRNTFIRLEGHEKLATWLFKFRNAISWGKFHKDLVLIKKMSIEMYGKEIEKDKDILLLLLEQGICIFCYGKIQWYKEFEKNAYIVENDYNEISCGYYVKDSY
jgi:hypothetical protein